jgi:hypothetical protein
MNATLNAVFKNPNPKNARDAETQIKSKIGSAGECA